MRNMLLDDTHWPIGESGEVEMVDVDGPVDFLDGRWEEIVRRGN